MVGYVGYIEVDTPISPEYTNTPTTKSPKKYLMSATHA